MRAELEPRTSGPAPIDRPVAAGRPPRRSVAGLVLAGICCLALAAPTAVRAGALHRPPAGSALPWSEDFEGDLERWRLAGERGIAVIDSGDPEHGRVLELTPSGDVYALIRGSEHWGGVRIEGAVLFPTDEHNYLGVIYNFQQRGERTDFGTIYIKGNGSYLRVNPHRDFNVGRTLYEEYKTPLTGEAAIEIGRWQRFAVEVIGRACHFYVGDMETPQLTFALHELGGGALGFKPRSVGDPVWIDDLRATAIETFGYQGPPRPAIDYRPEELLSAWQVLGPLARTDDAAARDPADPRYRWHDFPTDERGAVLTGRVADYHGPNAVAYFRTRIPADEAGEAILHLSTVDDLALWVNGRFHWFIDRDGYAWHDFYANPEHQGQRIPIDLVPGINEIVLRVRGGVYASGGFFARLEKP